MTALQVGHGPEALANSGGTVRLAPQAGQGNEMESGKLTLVDVSEMAR